MAEADSGFSARPGRSGEMVGRHRARTAPASRAFWKSGLRPAPPARRSFMLAFATPAFAGVDALARVMTGKEMTGKEMAGKDVAGKNMSEQNDPPPDSKLTRSKERWAREGRFLTGKTTRA